MDLAFYWSKRGLGPVLKLCYLKNQSKTSIKGAQNIFRVEL